MTTKSKSLADALYRAGYETNGRSDYDPRSCDEWLIVDNLQTMLSDANDDAEKLRIRMGEMAAEIDRLNAELEKFLTQDVLAVIAMDAGQKEPRLMSWKEMPIGQHRVYTHSIPDKHIPQNDPVFHFVAQHYPLTAAAVEKIYRECVSVYSRKGQLKGGNLDD